MKITVTIDEPTGDFQDRLLALLAEHAAHVETDTTWTSERAERYYLALPLARAGSSKRPPFAADTSMPTTCATARTAA